MGRITKHPVLPALHRISVTFSYNEKTIHSFEGEMIASALYAANIRIFGHHQKDGSAQGIYCASGQCSQCTVIANGASVKACMTPVSEGMVVRSCNSKPILPPRDEIPTLKPISTITTDCLIIGAGPAGISAAVEMAKCGVRSILVDDKFEMGGKLSLQTHNFFGSRSDCWAGTRGIDIARLLTGEIALYSGLIDVWLDAPAVGVFSDGLIGVVKNGVYTLVKPQVLLIATGAREKTLAFPGCDIPGVYGAGAFQTLVNRDRVRPSERLFICGGGNVGLIGGYHALQAGIGVVGLVEALPQCGGYLVHLDKLKRLGVPIYTSHTILRAHGRKELEAVTIAAVDPSFKPVAGTEKSFAVDTLLLAVGLTPVDELLTKARQYGMRVFAAGDAEEIAEASAAMFSGRIQGRAIAKSLDREIPLQKKWTSLLHTMREKPGALHDLSPHTIPGKIYPIFRCTQEIPCNPCGESCPNSAIHLDKGTLTGVPHFEGATCLGCAQCVLICPGLAIVLVDESYDPVKRHALLTVPFELPPDSLRAGNEVITVDREGTSVGTAKVIAFKEAEQQDHRVLVLLEVPFEQRLTVAGFRPVWQAEEIFTDTSIHPDDTIICRCERISKKEIQTLIRAGYRDMNQIKASLRTGMGACNGKNCTELILRLFREEKVNLAEVTRPNYRPPDQEVLLGAFAGIS